MSQANQPDTHSVIDLPLFPLGTVLYPDGYLPLQIFEMRYLTLIRECYDQGRPFGVITLMEGGEVQNPKEEILLSPVGTQAHITELAEESPSLLKVKIKGGQRFKLKTARQKRNGLWMGAVSLLADDQLVPVPEDLQACSHLLVELIASFNDQNIPKEQTPIQTPHKLDDCGWVSNRWCEVLPINQGLKLQLLSLDNPLVRLELINDIIRTPAKQS